MCRHLANPRHSNYSATISVIEATILKTQLWNARKNDRRCSALIAMTSMSRAAMSTTMAAAMMATITTVAMPTTTMPTTTAVMMMAKMIRIARRRTTVAKIIMP